MPSYLRAKQSLTRHQVARTLRGMGGFGDVPKGWNLSVVSSTDGSTTSTLGAMATRALAAGLSPAAVIQGLSNGGTVSVADATAIVQYAQTGGTGAPAATPPAPPAGTVVTPSGQVLHLNTTGTVATGISLTPVAPAISAIAQQPTAQAVYADVTLPTPAPGAGSFLSDIPWWGWGLGFTALAGIVVLAARR